MQELNDLADKIGEFIQYWGFKRVHGRIWAHLQLSKKPLDAYELRTRLKISKALVSLSLNDLLRYHVIEEIGKGDRGTLIYRAHPDPRVAIHKILQSRESQLLWNVLQATQVLDQLSVDRKQSMGVDQDGLNKIKTMVKETQDLLEWGLRHEKFNPHTIQNLELQV